MPMPVVNGVLTFIQNNFDQLNVWDGEVPRYGLDNERIIPEAFTLQDWPAIKGYMDEGGLAHEPTFEDPYGDEGPFHIYVWATSRQEAEQYVFDIFALLATQQAWDAIDVGDTDGNFVYKMLLERWTCLQEEEVRTQTGQLLYRGELHYQMGVHGSVATGPLRGFAFNLGVFGGFGFS